MKNIVIIIFLALFFGCATHQSSDNEMRYEIMESVTFKFGPNDAVKVSELRFTPKYSSTDLQKYMFEKFGKWDNSIEIDKKEKLLVWNDVKLLDDRNDLFTVAVSGDDFKYKTIEINDVQNYAKINYCSAIVFDSNNYDCLQESSEFRDILAEYFVKSAYSIDNQNVAFENAIASK